MNRFYWRNWSP